VKVRVRFFASLADRVGRRTEFVELAEESDVEALWRRLLDLHPTLAEIGVRPLVACDMAYANWDTPLEGVDEVAFLPPVSGG
jgi:molybdopterin converting factor subunit 1